MRGQRLGQRLSWSIVGIVAFFSATGHVHADIVGFRSVAHDVQLSVWNVRLVQDAVEKECLGLSNFNAVVRRMMLASSC